jgi:hypothetical protein
MVQRSDNYDDVMSQSKPLLRALIAEGIDDLATPANLRYGTAIHERGGVDFIETGPYRVTAWVGGLDGDTAAGGGQRRKTRISSTKAGLSWHCAGNPRAHDIFCKHCVALALAVSGSDFRTLSKSQ